MTVKLERHFYGGHKHIIYIYSAAAPPYVNINYRRRKNFWLNSEQFFLVKMPAADVNDLTLVSVTFESIIHFFDTLKYTANKDQLLWQIEAQGRLEFTAYVYII